MSMYGYYYRYVLEIITCFSEICAAYTCSM